MSGRYKAERSPGMSQFSGGLSLSQRDASSPKAQTGEKVFRAKLTDVEDLLLKLAEIFGTEVITLPAAISYGYISNTYFFL